MHEPPRADTTTKTKSTSIRMWIWIWRCAVFSALVMYIFFYHFCFFVCLFACCDSCHAGFPRFRKTIESQCRFHRIRVRIAKSFHRCSMLVAIRDEEILTQNIFWTRLVPHSGMCAVWRIIKKNCRNWTNGIANCNCWNCTSNGFSIPSANITKWQITAILSCSIYESSFIARSRAQHAVVECGSSAGRWMNIIRVPNINIGLIN